MKRQERMKEERMNKKKGLKRSHWRKKEKRNGWRRHKQQIIKREEKTGIRGEEMRE